MNSSTLMQSTALAGLEFLLKGIQVTNPSTSSCSRDDDLQKTVAQIDRLTLAADAFRKAVDHQLSFYRRRRNEMASLILHCPDKILAHILQYLCASWSNPHRPEVLRLICHRFHRVVESSPVLWSYIYVNELVPANLERTNFYLFKSKSVPLSILLNYSGNSNVQANVLDSILKHIHRWENVHLSLDIRTPTVQMDKPLQAIRLPERLSEAEAPLLQEFHLSTGLDHLWDDPVSLFHGCAPLIRNLDIQRLSVSWDTPLLSGLTSLDIYNWDGFKTPSADQYIRLLETCPQLSHLTVRGAGSHIHSHGPAIFQKEIRLPMLKELILSDIHPLTAGSILASVKASPELATIGSYSLPQDVAVDLLKLVGHAHDYSSISIAQTNPRELRVLQSSKSFNRFEVISEKDDGGRMTFSFFHQNYGTMFSSLGSFLDSSGRAKIQRLILNVPEYSNNGTYSCHHLLGDLNGLLDLHVENPGTSSEILILLQLRCPNLRRLKICIAYDHVLSDLLDFVSIRYSDDASKPLLARLENIEIHRTSTGNIFRSLSRISKITGKGVVRCITEWRNGEYVTRGEERL